MDNQEAFNRVVTHLRWQGRQSLGGENGSCRYRTREGLRCALGVLLTDEFYDSAFEGSILVDFDNSATPISCLTNAPVCRDLWRTILTALPGVAIPLLVSLQHVHDLHRVDEWEDQFHDVAQQFHLTMPPLITPVTIEGGHHELVSR